MLPSHRAGRIPSLPLRSAQTLAQPEEFDYLALLDDRYSSVRKFAPLLLAHFEFHAAPAATELLQALDLLRDLNASGKRTLPEHVPTGFVKPRWRPYVFTADGVDRHFYELCALAELRDRLRAGDIWVTGSRQYRDFETYLIPAATFKAMQQEPLPLAIDTQFTSYMTERREVLKEKMTSVACKAGTTRWPMSRSRTGICASPRCVRILLSPQKPLQKSPTR